MKLVAKIGNVLDKVIVICALLAAILIVAIMVMIDTQIVMRVIVGRGILWVIEICAHILLYITFLGSAWVLQKEGHVKMDLVLGRFKPKTQATINIITSIFGIIICLVLIGWGVDVTLEHYRQGYYLKTIVQPPTWPLLAVIPFGCFLLLVQFVKRTYGYVKERGIAPDNN